MFSLLTLILLIMNTTQSISQKQNIYNTGKIARDCYTAKTVLYFNFNNNMKEDNIKEFLEIARTFADAAKNISEAILIRSRTDELNSTYLLENQKMLESIKNLIKTQQDNNTL